MPTPKQEPTTRALIEECRAALAEELSAWDIDPPLHHVKQAHDRCVAWLAHPAPQEPAEPSEAFERVMKAAMNMAHVYSFVGDDSLPIAKRELEEVLRAALRTQAGKEPT